MPLPTDSGLTAELAGRLVRRLESNPEFLAFVFRRYQDAQGYDDARLAADLGVEQQVVTRLAICRRPRNDIYDLDQFGADVESIAEEFSLDPRALAEIVRFVDVINAVASAPSDAIANGFLAAARERAAEERAPYEADEDRTQDDALDTDDDDRGDPT